MRWPSISNNGIAVAFILEAFALPGNSLQAGEDEACQCFEAGVARQRKLILRFQIADADPAFEDHRHFPFHQNLLGGSDIEFVLDFAHDLLQNILDENYACC